MAFERIAYLEAVVGADITQFRRGMRDIRNDLGILSETTQGLSGIARTMTYTITAPLLALGTGMAKTAMDFEANMRNINSLLQLSEGEFSSLSNQIKDFGLTARGGAIGASEGFYQLVSAGYAGADAMDVFRVISKTAEAGLADLETTTKAVTATLLAYGMQGEESAWRVSNSLTRAVQVGVGTMSDFANNLPETRAVGNILGVDIEELDFAVARLTQLGFSVSEAGTRTKNVLKKLANPTEDMLELYEKLGISGGRELIGKFGLIGGLEELRKVVGENEQALTALFGESRATEGFTSLTNNIDDTNKALAEFYAGLDTATLDAWGEQSKSFAFQFDMFKSALEGVSIAIGEKILPIITPMLKGFTDWLNSIAKTNPELLDMGVKLGMIVAVLPPLLWLMSSLAPVLSLLGSGFSFVMSMGGLIPALFGTISTGLVSVLGGIAPLVAGIGGLVVAFAGLSGAIDFQQIVDSFTGATNEIVAQSQDVPTKIQSAMTANAVTIPATEMVKIEKGDSWWTVWQTQFMDDMDWETFKETLAQQGIDIKKPLQIGDMFEIQTGTLETQAVDKWKTALDNVATTVQAEPKKDIVLPFGITLPADIGTQLNNFFAGLRDIIGFDRLKESFESTLGIVQNFLNSFEGKDYSGIENIGKVFAIMALYLGQLVTTIATFGLEGVNSLLAGLGKMVTGVVDFLNAIGKGDLNGALEILITDIIGGMLAGVYGLVLDVLIFVFQTLEDALNAILGRDDIDLTTGIEDMKANMLAKLYAEPPVEAPVLVTPKYVQDPDSSLSKFDMYSGMTSEDLLAEVGATVTLPIDTIEFYWGEGVTPDQIPPLYMAEIMSAISTTPEGKDRENLIKLGQDLAKAYAIPISPTFGMGSDINDEMDSEFLTLNPFTNTIQTALDTMATTIDTATPASTLVQKTVDDMQAEADALVGSVDLTPLVADLTASDTSPSTYITTQLKPLEAEFIRIFGEQGTVTTLYKNFVSGFALDTVMLQTSMNGLLASTATVFTLLVGTITIAVSLIIGKLDDLKAKIDEVAGALGGLNTTMQAVPVVGATGGNGGSGSGGGSKTINIYGASSYQQIANEASRQGVPLVGKPSRE